MFMTYLVLLTCYLYFQLCSQLSDILPLWCVLLAIQFSWLHLHSFLWKTKTVITLKPIHGNLRSGSTHLLSPNSAHISSACQINSLCYHLPPCPTQSLLQKIGPNKIDRMSVQDPFQVLVDSLKKVLQNPPVSPAPSAPAPSPVVSSSPSQILFASPMAQPAPFSGEAEECNGFLLQCSLTIELQPQMFPTEQSKIAFVISALTGPALQWAETIWNQAGPATQSFSCLLIHFREVFGRSSGDSSIGEQLYQLKQGALSINQYSLKFRTLAAASGWNEPSLITAYRQGLNPKLRLHLAAYDDAHGLERFIQLAIRCSHRMLSCSPGISTAIAPPPNRQPEVHNPPEPMQTDTNRLTASERQIRLTQHLCLYCGASGHMILACPLRPPRPMVTAIQPSIQKMNPLSTCAQLIVSKNVISVSALLDSGSAGNFISRSLCHHLRLSTSTTETLYEVQSITGKPLTRRHIRYRVGPLQLQIGQLHIETLHLLVLEGSTVDIILGRPWLVQHNPILSWKTGEVLKGRRLFLSMLPTLPTLTNILSLAHPLHVH